MAERFVGKKIVVKTSREDGMPVSFIWRGQTYRVDDVERVWQDWGFPLGRAPRRQAWRARRHRNLYVVSSGGKSFEICRDRGEKGGWILLKIFQKGESCERSSVPETGS